MGIEATTFDKLTKGRRRLSYWNLVISTVCLLASTSLFLLLFFLPPSDRICITRSVTFERAAEAVKYNWVNFGDYFYPSSVYRHASPERDPAWEALMSRKSSIYQLDLKAANFITDDVISISESELSALHQPNHRRWKQLADGTFAAVLGIHHQMNCLVGRLLAFSPRPC
jgi:hypothetical protein